MALSIEQVTNMPARMTAPAEMGVFVSDAIWEGWSDPWTVLAGDEHWGRGRPFVVGLILLRS